MYVQPPSGPRVELYKSPDKNGKQRATEIGTKRLVGVMADVCSMQFYGVRSKGIVTHAWRAVACVEATEPGEPPRVLFKASQVANLGIDKKAVLEAFRATYSRPGDDEPWGG